LLVAHNRRVAAFALDLGHNFILHCSYSSDVRSDY
jgi:hypothetical protein